MAVTFSQYSPPTSLLLWTMLTLMALALLPKLFPVSAAIVGLIRSAVAADAMASTGPNRIVFVSALIFFLSSLLPLVLLLIGTDQSSCHCCCSSDVSVASGGPPPLLLVLIVSEKGSEMVSFSTNATPRSSLQNYLKFYPIQQRDHA